MIKHDAKKSTRPVDNTDDVPTPKRRKKDTEKLRRYPVNSPVMLENPETTEKHKKAIKTELAKSRPRDNVLLPLMKSTFGDRRMLVLSDVLLDEILLAYPALSRPAIVSY